MNISLEGKVVLVTGGTQGIGKAIAQSLSASGAHVAVHGNSSINKAKSEWGGDGNYSFYPCDLTDPTATLTLVERVVEDHNRLDVLINNAGIAIDSPLVKEAEDWLNDWDKTMQVNLNAVGILCREAIVHFRKKGGGIIITISSRAAFRGDTVDYLAYAASKGGTVALTRSIARGYGREGITAFNIAPGFTRTEMAEQFIEQYGEDYAAGDIALKELTRPEDISPLIVFLCSGKAAHATGGTFDVNAGSYVH